MRYSSGNECNECGKKADTKTGWTNGDYCSEQCERSAVSALHASMPNAGPLPRPGWIPAYIDKEIAQRWLTGF